MTAPLSREAAIQPQVDPEWIALAELLADRDRLLAENEKQAEQYADLMERHKVVLNNSTTAEVIAARDEAKNLQARIDKALKLPGIWPAGVRAALTSDGDKTALPVNVSFEKPYGGVR